jgi:hypothetical protein
MSVWPTSDCEVAWRSIWEVAWRLIWAVAGMATAISAAKLTLNTMTRLPQLCRRTRVYGAAFPAELGNVLWGISDKPFEMAILIIGRWPRLIEHWPWLIEARRC